MDSQINIFLFVILLVLTIYYLFRVGECSKKFTNLKNIFNQNIQNNIKMSQEIDDINNNLNPEPFSDDVDCIDDELDASNFKIVRVPDGSNTDEEDNNNSEELSNSCDNKVAKNRFRRHRIYFEDK